MAITPGIPYVRLKKETKEKLNRDRRVLLTQASPGLTKNLSALQLNFHDESVQNQPH